MWEIRGAEAGENRRRVGYGTRARKVGWEVRVLKGWETGEIGPGLRCLIFRNPKRAKNEIPSPRSLRYLIPVSGLPVRFKVNGTIYVLNGKRDSGTRFTSSKFCEQTGLYKSVPFAEKQPRRPETGMKNGIRISVWNIPSAKKIPLELPRMSYNNPATFQPDFPRLSNEIFRNLFVHHCKLPWPLFYCLGTPTWCTWRHVKRLYILVASSLCFKARLRAKPLIWNLMQIKLIYTTKLLHLASFWKWKFLELGKIVFLPGLALLAPLFSVNTSKFTASRVLPVPLEDAS